MQPCFYVKFLGVECPGCGTQRAFIELLKGNISGSLTIFPALLPGILLIMIVATHLIFKFKHGALYIKTLFMLNIVIMIFNYIYKLLTP